MYSTKLRIYLGENTRYYCCMDLCHSLGGLAVIRWYTLVTGHYKYIVSSLSWLSPKAENVWNVCKSNARWWQIFQHGWHSHFQFRAKVFIWRVMIGGLPLGSSLKRRRLGSGICFFCTILLEDNTHRFIKCPIACIIWKYLLDVWQVLTRCYLRPLTMGFFLVFGKWSKWWDGDIVPIFTILRTKT